MGSGLDGQGQTRNELDAQLFELGLGGLTWRDSTGPWGMACADILGSIDLSSCAWDDNRSGCQPSVSKDHIEALVFDAA